MDIKEIFLKPINVFIDDIDKFKEKELINKSPFAKSTWLINYIPKSIKTVGGIKNKIMNLFETNITKGYSKPTLINSVYSGRKKPRKSNIIKTIRRQHD